MLRCLHPYAGENASFHAGVRTPTTGLTVLIFFSLDEDAGPCTTQLCFGAAQLCSFCCHVGEMGQSVQPGMSAEVGLGHTPAAPVMEELCSHRDPGTIGPSAPLEVPATTVCAEM